MSSGLKRLIKRAVLKLKNRGFIRPTIHKNRNLILDVSSLVFDDVSRYELRSGTKVRSRNWSRISLKNENRLGFVINPGEQLQIKEPIVVGLDSVLFLRVSFSADRPNDQSRMQIQLQSEAVSAKLVTLELSHFHIDQYQEYQVDLSVFTGGWSSLICAVDGDSSVVIIDLCVTDRAKLGRVKAINFNQLRIDNEIAHFTTTYSHNVYEDVLNRNKLRENRDFTVFPLIPVENTIHGGIPFVDFPPDPGESAFYYGFRLLQRNVQHVPPNFLARLKAKVAEKGHISVLTLCCGAARYEAGWAAELGDTCDWTLLDINEELLIKAASHFPDEASLTLIKADANKLSYVGRTWDVILCISAMHHIVELESFVEFCFQSLNADGEYWSIGECVSRNGNRLWPDAYVDANKLFSGLPERFRYNHHSNIVDESLPDNDYSVGCFEGIRSEEIESCLQRRFIPVDVHLMNCFLWRMVNLAYSDNYDLTQEQDQNFVKDIVKCELAFYRAGGRPTELNGVYRKKQVG